MTSASMDDLSQRETLDRIITEFRPKLHRYCARMTGSVIDGEDLLQDVVVKAIEALPRTGPLVNPRGWLFRVARNAALDFLRRRARQRAMHADEVPAMMSDPENPVENRQIVTASLQTFMLLPVSQRSCVILMDVLGYSLEEISDIMETSIPAVKASLHRGRARLRELADEPDELPPPVMSDAERERFSAYCERFNAHDFDAIRGMLADDVRLELVNQTRMNGRREAVTYFSNYSSVRDWSFVPGFVERRPAILVRDPRAESARPAYFILLKWTDGQVVGIRDFRHARYAAVDADLASLG